MFYKNFIAFSFALSLAFVPFLAMAQTASIRNVQMLSGQGTMEITVSQPVYYQNVRGYLAKPKTPGQYPGVVMVHEYWGLNDNIKTMAQELAKNGYVVLAVDIYKGQMTDDPNRARELMRQVNQNDATANTRAAVAYLKNREQVSKIASLGWCFGGGQSLNLSTSGEKLDATVIYYGQLTSDKEVLKNITWPVLGIFGDQDQSISVQSVREFQTALNELGIINQIQIYPGVGHAFANPSGMNYAAQETRDAWEKTLTFLDMNLRR